MKNEMLNTEIDDFLMVLAEKQPLSLAESCKIMSVDEKTMQSWVDFLIEDKVLILDYNFLTPMIRLSPEKKDEFLEKKKKNMQSFMQIQKDKMGLRGDFFKKGKERGYEDQRIILLWKKFLEVNKEKIKKEFFDKAKKREIDGDLDRLWAIFYRELTG